MTPDPYPDLLSTEPPDVPRDDADRRVTGGRAELSEADSRLLDALSHPDPPVVTAVEDEPRTVLAAQYDRVAPVRGAGGRGPLAPVFQEPAG